MLSRQVGMRMASLNDYIFPFRLSADYLKSGDVTFGNLEDPVSDRGVKVGSIYSFRANPKVISGLVYAGFDVVSIANNHIFDYTKTAFTDTIVNLKNADIQPIGGGDNFLDAHKPWIKEIKGKTFAYLAYTDLYPSSLSAGIDSVGISYLDETQMVADIYAAKTLADYVIVSIHTGDEYQTKHNAKQDRIFKEAVDSGASFVIGNHPHVVQEVEHYKNGWIAYSLGNYIFDQNFSQETMTGLVLEAEIDESGNIQIKTFKSELNKNFQVSIDLNN
jgi:poly-gamma-glutamate capsule biosynthesis protein CapA/YwtB (metallophosphatase superfamily)